MYNQNNNQAKPAASFGSVQENYKYEFSGKYPSFKSGDEFTITEDLPRSKTIRFEIGEGIKKNADGTERKFESKTYLIRVICRGYEADMKIWGKDLPKLATLCPKGLDNFKGCTFSFDGYNWSYIGNNATPSAPTTPISSISQAMSARIPEPTEQVISTNDQINTFAAQLADKIKFAQEFKKIYGSDIQTWADKITPNNGKALVEYAKRQGLIVEEEGIFKVV